MPDCLICLVTFVADDELLVFACDPKHYFHSKCGEDWLNIKSECPLCRRYFDKQILECITKSEDIINEVARQAVHENGEVN